MISDLSLNIGRFNYALAVEKFLIFVFILLLASLTEEIAQ